MGALKAGDEISIRKGVDDISGDQTVTIKSITTDNTPHRVYNLEVESRDGEITHNYFVGEDELWVYNVHGNSLNSPRRAFLYALYCGGQFVKWGITQNIGKRYSGRYLRDNRCGPPIALASGCRRDIRDRESELIKTRGGPWNLRG